MTRLLRVELTRLTARRVTWILALLLLGGLLVVNGVRFSRASNDLAGARAKAQQDYERQRERVRAELGRARAEFERERATNPGMAPEAGPPPVEEILAHTSAQDFFVDPRYRMRAVRDDVTAVGILVAVLAFVVGTTFAGAEWAAGTMQALLFWEPRRMRVMGAKLLALALTVLGAAAVAMLLQFALSLVTAELRGTFAGTSPQFYRELLWRGLRLAALAPFTGLLAFGLAGLTRHTAAALAAGFVYFAILENVIRGVRPGWQRYLVTTQFVAWVEKRLVLAHEAGVAPPHLDVIGGFEKPFVLTMNRAGLTLAGYLAVVLAVMVVLFVRRDVT